MVLVGLRRRRAGRDFITLVVLVGLRHARVALELGEAAGNGRGQGRPLLARTRVEDALGIRGCALCGP